MSLTPFPDFDPWGFNLVNDFFLISEVDGDESKSESSEAVTESD
jgi:hypothetical protein